MPSTRPVEMHRPLPLSGIRVLEPGMNLAVPLAARLLADMGAEVIKIESPTRIEPGRTMYYPDDTPGKRFWDQGGFYHEASRNKLGLAIDLNKEEGRELFRELVKTADVVIENFTPRVMKYFGLDYPNLRRIRPDLVMLSNTGFGHSGPWAGYKAFGMSLEPITGLSHFTGYTGGPPTRTAIAYTDSPVAMFNAYAVLAALEYRSRTGKGQWIDMSMYEVGVSLMAEAMMDYFVNGRTGGRVGNRDPLLAPQGCYRCAGRDRWVAISIENDEQWASLCQVMGKAELAKDPRFAHAVARRLNQDALDAVIGEWTSSMDHYEVMHRLQAAGLPAGAVLTNKEQLEDPHLVERGFFEWVNHPPEQEMRGERLHPGIAWKVGTATPHIRLAAPSLGEHNHTLLTELVGLAEGRIRELEQTGVIGDQPTYEEAPTIRGVQELMAAGTIWPPDADFHKVLAQRESHKEQGHVPEHDGASNGGKA